jgi:hypothetical protein
LLTGTSLPLCHHHPQQVLEQLKGKSVEDIIKEGVEKLADVPSGGGGGGGGGGTSPTLSLDTRGVFG